MNNKLLEPFFFFLLLGDKEACVSLPKLVMV